MNAHNKEGIKPLGRWKESLTPAEAGAVESIGAIACGRVGYELTVPTAEQRRSLRQSWMKRIYPVFLDGKLLLKVQHPLEGLPICHTI